MAKREQPTRSEINELITRVQGMPDLAKFELFSVLREELAGSVAPENPEVREIRERREALDYIGKAAEVLELGPREAPTQAQFDRISKEREWPWTGARINRVWERWRIAADAFVGTRTVEHRPARERRKKELGKKGETIPKHLQALKTWLDTKPEFETPQAYDDFAKAYNRHVPDGAIPMAKAVSVKAGIPLSWENCLAVARETLTLDVALEKELTERLPKLLDENTLVGFPIIARMLKVSTYSVEVMRRENPNFPTAVAHLSRSPGFAYEDVKLFQKGLKPPQRRLDEYQRSIIGIAELASLLSCGKTTIRNAIRGQKWTRTVPPPEGSLATGVFYWRVEKVEGWLDQEAKEAKKKAAKAKTKKDRQAAEKEARQRSEARDRAANEQERLEDRQKNQRQALAVGASLGSSVQSRKRRRAAR